MAEPNIPADPKPWVQPLFLVYDMSTDKQVPLTQERLDQLLAAERQYSEMIRDIRDSHNRFAQSRGYMPKPFSDVPEGR